METRCSCPGKHCLVQTFPAKPEDPPSERRAAPRAAPSPAPRPPREAPRGFPGRVAQRRVACLPHRVARRARGLKVLHSVWPSGAWYVFLGACPEGVRYCYLMAWGPNARRRCSPARGPNASCHIFPLARGPKACAMFSPLRGPNALCNVCVPQRVARRRVLCFAQARGPQERVV